MKTLTLAGAVIAAALRPLAAGAAIAAESDVILFGKDPGDGKAFACFTRAYDASRVGSRWFY